MTVLCCTSGLPTKTKGEATDTKANNQKSVNDTVSIGSNVKTDNSLMTSPFSELRSSIKLVPVFLSILGKMNLISTQNDVSLVKGQQNKTFEHLVAPDSLRASLTQLDHETYWAFNEANSAMNEIMRRTNKVPGIVEDTLNLLLKGSSGEIKAFLPIHTKNIKEVVIECGHRVQNISTAYLKVLYMIQELTELTTREQSYTQKLMDENARQKVILEIEEEYNKERKSELEVRLQKANDTFEERNIAFKETQKALSEGGSSKEALSDASYALELAERKLKDAKNRMDVLVAEKNQLNGTQKLTSAKLAKGKLTEQLQLLYLDITGLKALASTLDNFIRYFQEFAQRIDVLLETPLNTFVDLTEHFYENELYKDVANRPVSREMLYKLLISISVSAHNIYDEAAAYVELSREHFMPVVSELTELIALDRDDDKSEIKRREARIKTQADTMWIEINNILLDRERKFDNAVEARIKELRNLFTDEIVAKLPEVF